MNRKDILELKRRYKKDQCTFTKMCGCYVNGEKEIKLEFKETFLNLAEEEYFKYLDISKKVLSGGIGNNLLELNFSFDSGLNSSKQNFLMRLRNSALKDDVLLREFYDSVIGSFDHGGNFLILLFHDAYDVMTKTSDNLKLDESEEVYEYILCAICPVSLTKPGLGYFDQEQQIKSRIRDWVVELPSLGFVYPGFIDRSTDVDTVMYYTKDAKDPHPELMEETLGCGPKKTATIQKETFQSIIKNSVSTDEEVSEKIFVDIQENLNTMIEEYKEIYEDTDAAPIALSKEKVRGLLIDSGVSEEITEKIEVSFEENFGEAPPLAEALVDTKLLKANAQKKKENELIQQVEALEQKLVAFQTNKTVEDEDLAEEADDAPETEEQEENTTTNYDVVLHVKPEKLANIKTEIINGKRCILIPIEKDEQATINGVEHVI